MNQIWLNLELTEDEYRKLVKHIHSNMFFGIKRIAPNLRHLILHSVGDNIDLTLSEIFIEKKIDDNKISTDDLATIIKNLFWYIKLTCKNEYYMITVDKKTDMITDRDFTKKALEI